MPIGLAAIVMVLYNYPLVDWYLKQNQPVYAVSESEQAVENQARDQKNLVDAGDQEVQSNIEVQTITKDSQDITTASKNITVSGWVGTEFGENIGFEKVILYSPSQKTYHSVVTGPSGEFQFTDLRPGWDYVLKVSPQGRFKRYTKSQIKLRFDQEVYNIVLESIPLGILSGRIVDPYDRPVTGINLLIQTVGTVYWTRNVITDANGSF
ncbi:MAG: carboxypeptidase-like regulatory domain-containing protein, partial [Gammaproteobacteria bacterium]